MGKKASRAGCVVGAIVTLGCLALAPLDGGLSAFASASAFQAAFGAGAILLPEVGAAIVAGGVVETMISGEDSVFRKAGKGITGISE